ncbi:hypothetical protein O4215_20425 [Rhodococcus maanshanensis]|uniref:hypothetical protein n=1 Tax=Rhodococcus maanshanensis TaxID=183556 RepID=UPI0022B4F355|nr:hypothetical protein [Rhodococcus maanshanensis]MCZ4557930.1 hypothetical protein [Rhodococcus maanshanensis]
MTCGTRNGYDKHRRDGEEACQPCKDAKAKWSRVQRALRGRYCQVPPLLLAQLYLSAPIALQLKFELAVGESVAAALVQRLDQAETPQ